MQETAVVLNVCTSLKKGTQKTPVGEVHVIQAHGIQGDAHAGDGPRQVSLLADESAGTIRRRGVTVGPGDFGENILTRGIALTDLGVGSRIAVSEVVLEVTQVGKTCHARCAIYDKAGLCVMPTDGIFCSVIEGGIIRPGDTLRVLRS
jgi:MOSC domain-containing protein YiiM